jgi:hypothetical protein
VTDIELGAFLSASGSPEHEALLRLIGASIFNPRGAQADDEPLAVNTGREWSDAEMNGLGEMLVRGVSIDETARRLRRDKIEVQAQPTLLDLGKPSPNATFTAVIYGDNRAKFGTPETSLRGKRICVTGKISDCRGKAEIVLTDPSQLSQ